MTDKDIVQKISVLKGKDDIDICQSKMQDVLFQLGLEDHSTPDVANDASKKAAITMWDTDNQNTLVNIQNQVKQGAYIHVMSADTAIATWDQLKERLELCGMLAK